MVKYFFYHNGNDTDEWELTEKKTLKTARTFQRKLREGTEYRIIVGFEVDTLEEEDEGG